MKANTKVKKWGNSLAIRIPNSVVEDLGLAENSNVQIASNGSSATIKPLRFKGKTLDQLVGQITPDNVYDEFEWGKPAGKEIW